MKKRGAIGGEDRSEWGEEMIMGRGGLWMKKEGKERRRGSQRKRKGRAKRRA